MSAKRIRPKLPRVKDYQAQFLDGSILTFRAAGQDIALYVVGRHGEPGDSFRLKSRASDNVPWSKVDKYSMWMIALGPSCFHNCKRIK